jgi:hypothetical protein
MATVVTVHAPFHELWGQHQTAGRWIPALRDGLTRPGAEVVSELAAPFDGTGTWPRCVRRWTNITAVNDPVAVGRPLAAEFPGVAEVAGDNGHRAHDPEPSLRSAARARTVPEGVR